MTSAVERPAASPSMMDELVDGGDPYACTSCAAAGRTCEFHTGWGAGWDACTAFMASVVEAERASELTAGLGDVEEVR